MKFKSSRGIYVFFGIFVVLALFMNPAFAQSQLQKTQPSQPYRSVKVQIKPELIKIYTRPPIPFKPFTYSDFKDPKTGQMLKPDQMVTLSHLNPPRQIRGDQFINEINQLERDYNRYGYTYRTPGEIVIGEMVIRKELLKTQADRIMSKTKKFSPSQIPQPLDAQTFKRIHSENMAQAQIRSIELKKAFQTISSPSTAQQPAGKVVMKAERPSVKPPEFKPFHQEGRWNESYGDPDLYAIHQDISMVLDGQKERLTVTANSELGITIFNTKFTIVGGTANLNAPGPDATGSNIQGDFSVKYLGTIQRQVTIDPTSIQPISGYVPIIAVPEISTPIPLPTPIGVSIGYAGTIGINYDFSVTPLAINCQITPVAGNLTQVVNLSYGVGIPGVWNICTIGCEGRLLFLSDRPTLIGELSVKPFTATLPTAVPGEVRRQIPGFRFKGVTQCFDNFTALRGSFYITFTVDLLLWSDKKKFLVYDNVGFEHFDYLFDETRTQEVFI